MRTAALVVAGFLILTGVAELQAQDRDTTSTQAQASSRLEKVKARPESNSGMPPAASSRDIMSSPVVPPKTQSPPAPRREDSMPVFIKAPKTREQVMLAAVVNRTLLAA
jgi:hypothetical protein